MVEDSAKNNRADSKKGIPNGNIKRYCFELSRVLFGGVFHGKCLVHGIGDSGTVVASVYSPVSQYGFERLRSISLNLKERIFCLSLKVYFLIVEKVIVPDYCPTVVVDHLSDPGSRVCLVGVCRCRYIPERCVDTLKCDLVWTVFYKMLSGELSL
jgi:hypothetical protein